MKWTQIAKAFDFLKLPLVNKRASSCVESSTVFVPKINFCRKKKRIKRKLSNSMHDLDKDREIFLIFPSNKEKNFAKCFFLFMAFRRKMEIRQVFVSKTSSNHHEVSIRKKFFLSVEYVSKADACFIFSTCVCSCSSDISNNEKKKNRMCLEHLNRFLSYYNFKWNSIVHFFK